jgi:GR25 family glycosyltransferase involved in LPS biosynthesis
MSVSWNGYFINLDRSVDRRASVEAEIAKAGLGNSYRRFAAVDGKGLPASRSPLTAGERGCFLSHYELIRSMSGQGFVHILEDDAVLAGVFPQVMARLLASNAAASCDLIYTDVMLSWLAPEMLRRMKARYDESTLDAARLNVGLIDLREFRFSGTNSYFLNLAGLAKVRQLMERELAAGPTVAIDLFYRREVQAGRLRALCVFPFVSCIHLGLAQNNTVSDRPGGTVTAYEFLRSAFFLDANVDALQTVLDGIPRLPRDKRITLIEEVQRRILTD